MADRSSPRFSLGRFLRQALAELHLPQKVIGIDLKLDAAFVSHILRGDMPLPPRCVDDLPVSVQRAMCMAWATDLGLFIGERERLVAAARAIVEQAEQEEDPPAIRRFPIRPETPPSAPRARVRPLRRVA